MVRAGEPSRALARPVEKWSKPAGGLGSVWPPLPALQPRRTLATGSWAVAGLVAGASTATGTVVSTGKKAGQAAAGTGRVVASGAGAAAGTVAGAGRKAKEGIRAGASKVGKSVTRSASVAKKGLSKAIGVFRSKWEDEASESEGEGQEE